MESYNEWLGLHNKVDDRVTKLEDVKDLPTVNQTKILQLEIRMDSVVTDLNDNISNTDQLKTDLSVGMKGMYKFLVIVVIAIVGIPVGAMYYNTNKIERSNISVIQQIKKSDSLHISTRVDYEIRLRVIEASKPRS